VPVALVAASRARDGGFARTTALLAAAIVTAALAILAPALVWVAAAFVIAATRTSRDVAGETSP